MPAVAASEPDDPSAATPVDSLIADGAEISVTGQYLVAADGDPDAPETVVRLDSGTFVSVDAASIDPAVKSGDMIVGTVEVPGSVIAAFPSSTLAEIAAADDVASAAVGPIDGDSDVAGLLLDAVADGSERLAVVDESAVGPAESPGSVDATLPGPYVHTMHVVFITRDSRGVFWTKSQLDGYVNGLSQWWNRESRGAVTATYNWNDVVGIQSDIQCSSSLSDVQTAATVALQQAGKPVYSWTSNASQHHLVVLTASDEETAGCSHGFSGHGWLLTDFSSPGAMRNIVSANADMSQLSPLGTFIHETGHNFGLAHAGSLGCPSGGFDGDLTGSGACSVSNYGNRYNIMGSSSGGQPYSILASQKAKEHLIDDGEGYLTINTPVSNGLYTITTASTTNMTARQGLRILDSMNGQSRTYWVDYFANAEGGGVEVNRAHARVDANEPESLMLFPAHSANTGQALFHSGDSFFSQSGKLRITVIDVDDAAGTATVSVNLANEHLGLNVSQSSWEAPEWGGSRQVFVDANGAQWSASASDPWLTVNPASSNGRVATIAAGSFDGTQRSGTVTITAGSRTAVITVTQRSISDDCAATISTTCAFTVNGDGATAAGSLERGNDHDYWRFVPPTSGTWAISSSASGDTYGYLRSENGSQLLANDDDAGNYQFLLARDLVAGTTYYVEIKHFSDREGATGIGAYTLTALPARVTLSPQTWAPPVGGGTQGVVVTSTTRLFGTTTSAEWLTVSPSSGTSALNGQEVAVTAAANPGPARTGTVTFTAGTASSTFTVTQAGTGITVSPESWSPDHTAQTMTVQVATSGGSWSVQSAPPWVTVSPASGSGGTATISVAANPGAERQGNVVFTANGATATVTIAQRSAPVVLAVSPSAWDAPAPGGTGTVNVTLNYGTWTVQSAPQWVSVSPTAGSTGAVTLTAAVNAGAAREGVVVFASGAHAASVTVRQGAGAPADDCAATTGTSCVFTLNGDTGTATGSLERGSDHDYWRFVAPSSGTWTISSAGTGDVYGYLRSASDGQLTYNDDSNGTRDFTLVYDLVAGQTYYVQVRNYSSVDTNTNTGPYTLTARPARIGLSSQTWEPGAAAASLNVAVTSSTGGFTTSTSASWLSASPAAGSSAWSGQIVAVSVAANPGAQRTGTMTFSAGTASVTLRVTQAGPWITVSPTSWSPGHVTQAAAVEIATSQPGWSLVSKPSWLSVASVGVAGLTTVVVAENTGEARQGDIVFGADGSSVTARLTVSQSGAPTVDDCAASTSTGCVFVFAGGVGSARGSLERGSDHDYWRFVAP
ncbi:MAG: hypothetical protein LBK59_09155, partial [Bifidobacteriaceae bacterium]|nr:hypothetical protein [Bifidobacteriaceae bacterium]